MVAAMTEGSSARSAIRRGVQLVAWLTGLTVVLAGAVAAGAAPGLEGPPVGGPGELARWMTAREPVAAALALVRLGVVVVAAYLLLVMVLGTLARLLGSLRLVALVDVVSVPAVRRVVSGAVGVGLAGAAVVPAGASVWAGPATPPSEQPQPADGEEGAPLLVPGPPTLHRLDHPAAVPAGPPAVAAEVTLHPGDHLWAVAERALAGAWGRAPTAAEVAPYWAGLVEANRPRLPDPGNPDLVFPGDTVLVPPPPPAPGAGGPE